MSAVVAHSLTQTDARKNISEAQSERSPPVTRYYDNGICDQSYVVSSSASTLTYNPPNLAAKAMTVMMIRDAPMSGRCILRNAVKIAIGTPPGSRTRNPITGSSRP